MDGGGGGASQVARFGTTSHGLTSSFRAAMSRPREIGHWGIQGLDRHIMLV